MRSKHGLTLAGVRAERERIDGIELGVLAKHHAYDLFVTVLTAIKAGGLRAPTIKAMCRAALGEDEPVKMARNR